MYYDLYHYSYCYHHYFYYCYYYYYYFCNYYLLLLVLFLLLLFLVISSWGCWRVGMEPLPLGCCCLPCGISPDWKRTSFFVIFKGRGDRHDCNCYYSKALISVLCTWLTYGTPTLVSTDDIRFLCRSQKGIRLIAMWDTVSSWDQWDSYRYYRLAFTLGSGSALKCGWTISVSSHINSGWGRSISLLHHFEH